MTHKSPLSPREARDEMIRGIRRRLVGPKTNSAEDLHWPGSEDNFRIVDSSFEEEQSYPYGPWKSPNDEEVLPQSPLFVYPVGALRPKMTDQAIEDLVVREEEILVEAAEDELKDGSDIEVDVEEIQLNQQIDIDNESDETDASTVGNEAQSMGVSIRIPSSVSALNVTVTGGLYSEIQVTKQPRSWWKRTDFSFSTTFPTTTPSTINISENGFHATVGVEVRPQSDGNMICTVWIKNTGESSDYVTATRQTLFQAQLRLTSPQLLPYEPFRADAITGLDLLYRKVDLFAIGHGCDTKVEAREDGYVVDSVTLPEVHLFGLTPDIKREDGRLYEIEMLDLAELNSKAQNEIGDLISDYQRWIDDKRSEIPNEPTLRELGEKHLDECQRFLNDIIHGWNLVLSDNDVQRCLLDASRAMDQQRVAYGAEKRESFIGADGVITVAGQSPHKLPASRSKWRPFQIAFILSSLRKIVNVDDPSRNEVDVIWMPTGGGKTEAYLGLAAFTILWEKMSATKNSDPKLRNTKVFMRYTLRLLTVQQITRAASLICALELLRRDQADVYGTEEIRIGAWLGSSVTSTQRKYALGKYADAIQKGEDLPFILRQCPWCAAGIGATSTKHNLAIGYRVIGSPGASQRVIASCPDPQCPFTAHTVIGSNNQTLERGIPLFEVDEDVYAGRPDFVVGTIDKVARMAWRTDTQQIFGLRDGIRKTPPPSLFIQDELHLISGPLGSIDGVFEVMLEHLCTVQGGHKPAIVAATATTKNFEDQVKNLYLRDSRVIPPPGLLIDDSFFAKEDTESDGKMYVGISGSSSIGSSKIQTQSLAMLAHQAAALEFIPASPDPYWSNVVFFSSRRALASLTSAVETTFRSDLNLMHALSGIKTGPEDKDGKRRNARYIDRVREITATSSEDVGKVLNDLSIPYNQEDTINLCFATSMVEVGLDVPRLGLMTVIGQPKSASQYIQVTGRVGRSKNASGLVVTVLNPRVARDRAHYENFSNWHNKLYASVESTSITPFTSRALERSLASVMTVMCRVLGQGATPHDQFLNYWDQATAALTQRATSLGGDCDENLQSALVSLHAIVSDSRVSQMKWTSEEGGGLAPLAFTIGGVPPARSKTPHVEILNSMRNVDQDAHVRPVPVAATTVIHQAGAVVTAPPVKTEEM